MHKNLIPPFFPAETKPTPPFFPAKNKNEKQQQIHVALRRTPSQPSPLERSMSRTTDATTAVVGSSERSSFAIHEPPFLRFSTGGKITADDDEFPLAAEFVPPTTLSDFHLLHTMPATSDRGVDERQRWPASSSISFSLSLTSHGRRR
nr:hypothetical protein Iba_scaffold34173CG0020 [Ipomoea batatas]